MKKNWSIGIIIVPVIAIAIALFTFVLPFKAGPAIGIETTQSFLANKDRLVWNDLTNSKVLTTSVSQSQQSLGSFMAESLISDRRQSAIPEDVRELLPKRVLQLIDRREQKKI